MLAFRGVAGAVVLLAVGDARSVRCLSLSRGGHGDILEVEEERRADQQRAMQVRASDSGPRAIAESRFRLEAIDAPWGSFN